MLWGAGGTALFSGSSWLEGRLDQDWGEWNEWAIAGSVALIVLGFLFGGPKPKVHTPTDSKPKSLKEEPYVAPHSRPDHHRPFPWSWS